MEKEIFQRAEALLGTEAMERIGEQRVIIFGTGGVGSWCAEALVRTGLRKLTIVDFDCVEVTNINRQLMATTQTVGQPKVEALRERLLTINPDAEITALQKTFTEETADSFDLDKYDYIIDAIDSLKDKVLLILKACETEAKLFSSMGAALKLNPTKIQVSEFWKVKGDPLARALRNRFRKAKQKPQRKFQCVYSEESPLIVEGQESVVKGSLVHITATFGMTLAGLVVQDIKRLVLLLLVMVTMGVYAQNNHQKRQDIDLDSPTFVPTVKVGKVLENGDSIQYMEMNNVYVYPPITFSSKKQQQAYNRLVKNVKIVLPIAKEARAIMMETAEYLETLPDKKTKEAHMKRVEKSIMKEYKPRMKKLTFSQGKLLIKLIYRESNSSGYELIQAFLGPVRAGFYQAFAWAFGASLKKKYDPEGIDRLTERVVLMVEAGQI